MIVLDSHSDKYDMDLALATPRCLKKDFVLPYPYAMNSFSSVYPSVEDFNFSNEEKSKNYKISAVPYIIHYGNNRSIKSKNFHSLDKKEDINELRKLLKTKSTCFHIDPDVLTSNTEITIAREYAEENDGVDEETCEKFMKNPDNPFYSCFGCSTYYDLKGIFNLNLSELYIAEAFHYFNRRADYHIQIGRAIIGWLASEFMKKLDSKTKVYLIESVPRDTFGKREDILAHMSDPFIAMKNVKEIVEYPVENNNDKVFNQSEYDAERDVLRDEILKQKHPIVVSSTHAGAGFVLEDMIYVPESS